MTTSVDTAAAPRRTDYATLYTEVSAGIAVLTINRPEVRNAVDRQVQQDIRAAVGSRLRRDGHWSSETSVSRRFTPPA